MVLWSNGGLVGRAAREHGAGHPARGGRLPPVQEAQGTHRQIHTRATTAATTTTRPELASWQAGRQAGRPSGRRKAAGRLGGGEERPGREGGRERGCFHAQTNRQIAPPTHPLHRHEQALSVMDTPDRGSQGGREGRNSDTSLSIVVVPLDQPVLALISLLFARNTQHARHAVPEYYIQAAAYVP